MGRGRRGVLLAAAIGTTTGPAWGAGPAAGHEEAPGSITVFDRAVPELPPGVRVQVVRSAADQLVLGNDTGEEVEVLADTGEPFLRIGPSGTFANLASPSWYAVQLPEPTAAAPPPGAVPGAATPPRWEPVTAGRAFGWFDHRLHPAPVPVPAASEPGVVLRLGDWRVPVRIGGRPVELLGHREFTRLAGSVATTVDHGPLSGTGLKVSVASGRVPAVVLDATGAVASGPVVVLGESGEPMLRFTADAAEANLASPTWALTAAARGGATSPRADGAVAEWQHVAQAPALTWLEPRAAYQPGVPPAHVQRSPTPVELGTWTVPLEVGGRRVDLRGANTWVPDPGLVVRPEERGAGPVVAALGVVVATGAVVCALLLLRRRRAGTAADGAGHG